MKNVIIIASSILLAFLSTNSYGMEQTPKPESQEGFDVLDLINGLTQAASVGGEGEEIPNPLAGLFQSLAPNPAMRQSLLQAGLNMAANKPTQNAPGTDSERLKNKNKKLHAAREKLQNAEENLKKATEEIATLKANQYNPTFFDRNKTPIVSALLVTVGAGSYIIGRNQAAKEDN